MLQTLFKAFRAIVFFLIGFFGVCILAGCYQGARLDNQPVTANDCHWVNHAAGKTCVPNRIERLVVLNRGSFDNAIALGLQPVATVTVQRLENLFSDQLSGVVDLGSTDSPNLERMLQLRPDLILGFEKQRRVYNQASQIAPTVLIPSEHSGDWKERFSFTANALDKSDQAKEVIDAYNSRLEDFKRAMGGDSSSPTQSDNSNPTISIVRIYPDKITLYTNVGFIGTILEDAGLPRPPSQDLNLEETQASGFSPIQYTISREAFDKADGDTIFVIVGNRDEKIDDVLTELKADPLWSQLKAVQHNAVYKVGDHWVGSGPIAANVVIDDLYKYLVNTP